MMLVNRKEWNCFMCKNRRMLTRSWIISIMGFDILACRSFVMCAYNITTCEEFSNGAHFDPYDVVDSMWKIFYFWSETSEINPIIFSLPAEKRLKRFKEVVDAVDHTLGVEWHKATFLMEPRPGVQVLLLRRGTPGAFRALVKQEQRNKARPNPKPLIKLTDVRMKTEGRYFSMICCEDLTAFALARVDEMPTTEEECETTAATLGLRGPGGRSFFYFEKK